MNKSFLTNALALVAVLMGYGLKVDSLFYIGMFALSGAFTNWVAIHMLFEKVPFLYGSGVIPAKFEQFKLAIKSLMMEQFFTEENISKFMAEQGGRAEHFDFVPLIESTDLSPAFNSLVSTIEQSQFAGMLAMVGGSEALQPMKEPFIEKMKSTIADISLSETFRNSLDEQLNNPKLVAGISDKVEAIIDSRLEELTPQLVKEIIQTMIRTHLGWLVVWGGVFGGLFGCISYLLS